MQEEELQMHIDEAKQLMDDAIEHLNKELAKISTGKASPRMLDGVLVDYYGAPTPLNQVANVGTSDSKTITIQPWEKSMLAPIEKAIFEANLGLTPQNDGELIRINIPMLTEERRKELAKRAKALGEETKQGIRAARRDGMDAIKKAVKEGYPEDAGKDREDEIQDMTNSYNSKIDKLVDAKEGDIMQI